jgi:hypothetical protein
MWLIFTSYSSECQQLVPVIDSHDYYVEPQSTEEKLEAALKRIEELEHQFEIIRIEKFGLTRISGDPDQVRFYTGFSSYEILKLVYDAIVPQACKITSWTQYNRKKRGITQRISKSTGQKLCLFDQFFLYLHKIRLGSLDQDLADKFKVSQSTVSRIVITWSNFLYALLGSQPLWPSKRHVQKHLPSGFKENYPDTRVILDCTELRVQTPSSLMLNSELYSHYKGTTTYKALIGITPSGAISFISQLYSGSISDKHITRISGILNLLEPGDGVMVDKGFKIEDLLGEKDCSLVIPVFLEKKGQFTEMENEQNDTISNLRVHVERAIRRIRGYHIFDGILPLNLVGTINQIWTVCCILSNFQGPLIKKTSSNVKY